MSSRFSQSISVILGLLLATHTSLAFEKQADGVLFKLTKASPTGITLLKIQVCTENIIRVIASPDTAFSLRPSLMVDHTTWKSVPWSVKEQGSWVDISTSDVTVRVHTETGELAFLDSRGHQFLGEAPGGGKSVKPAVVLGEQTFHIRQIFDSPSDEAFYGLGGHQNSIMNYKGHDVDLWQHNMVESIPFLVSNKGYGILWDNNSHTKFGDIREYESLSPIRLFNKDGAEGSLSAEYFRDARFDTLFTSRSEPRIEHEYVDVHDAFPDGFAKHIAAVRWSGSIECREPGLHKFRLFSSGYVRLWINDSLVVDAWRQNWNAWTYFPRLEMSEGKKYHIKLEWIHEGGYVGLQCLGPDKQENSGRLSLYSEVADQIDYYVVHGSNADEVIHGYREITGKAPMMPRWAMGFWQSREHYNSQEDILSTVREFRQRQIPLDNIVQDWFYWKEDQWGEQEFDPSRYPDPSGMMKTLHDDLHAHIMISVWPKMYAGTGNFEEFKRNGWLYMRNVEKKQKDWVGPGYVSTFYDAYNDSARARFWQLVNERLFKKGIDAWWLDCSEPDIQSSLSRTETILRQGPTALGSPSRYLNSFSLMNAKGIYEGQRRANNNQRVYILTRSAFAGLQRYAATTWSGDLAARWYDLNAQISSGCNFCLSGIPYWSMDIGGFAVEARYEHPNAADLEEWREQLTRWFQFGAFCPIFRSHGQLPYREMFNVAPPEHPAFQSMLAYDKLRYRLMPYIYSLAGMVTRNDYTIMRGLVMDFASDPKVLAINDQYMFGPAFLINPVGVFKARTRSVYLPAGSGWYDFHSGKFLAGGQAITADAPYTDMPIFVRAGSIVPIGPDLQYTGEKAADPIRLYVFTGRDCSFTLYEDEGTNYNYEQGRYASIPLSYDDAHQTLTIGAREGTFAGMLLTRTFEIVWVKGQNASAPDFSRPPDRKITYDGSQQIVAVGSTGH